MDPPQSTDRRFDTRVVDGGGGCPLGRKQLTATVAASGRWQVGRRERIAVRLSDRNCSIDCNRQPRRWTDEAMPAVSEAVAAERAILAVPEGAGMQRRAAGAGLNNRD